MENIYSVKYVPDARDEIKDGGLDCWGFSLEYMKLIGAKNIPPVFAITGEELKRKIIEGQMDSPSWVKLKRPESGSVVLFRFFSGRFHCGVVCEDCLSFIHCGETGVRKDRLDHPAWARIRVGFYNYVGDDNEQAR